MVYSVLLSAVFLLIVQLSQVYAGRAINTEGELIRMPQHSSSTRARSIEARDESSWVEEGLSISSEFWNYFWDPEFQHFRTQRKTSETVGSWNGETLWPYIIGVEALLEAEAARPGEFADEIDAALAGLEKFFSPVDNAYTAWVYTTGNKDIYFDDNAQVVIALLRAYELSTTSKATYLSRAKAVTDFLVTGWDQTNGGMIWHLGDSARNACTTSLTAVAMLTLAKMGHGSNGKRQDELIGFSRRAVEWILNELQLESGLIEDGVGGGPTYTYNTGITLHAICLLQELSPSSDLPAKAQRLADAALDRNKSLFDTTVPNAEYRYWWDNTFFLHLLIEGLSEYIRVFGGSQADTVSKIKWEFTRHMEYLQTYIKDPNDGLYYRGLRLYTISLGHLERYKAFTGDTGRQPQLNMEERYTDSDSLALPVGTRGMAKTLLGSGGAARSFLIAARNV